MSGKTCPLLLRPTAATATGDLAPGQTIPPGMRPGKLTPRPPHGQAIRLLDRLTRHRRCLTQVTCKQFKQAHNGRSAFGASTDD